MPFAVSHKGDARSFLNVHHTFMGLETGQRTANTQRRNRVMLVMFGNDQLFHVEAMVIEVFPYSKSSYWKGWP